MKIALPFCDTSEHIMSQHFSPGSLKTAENCFWHQAKGQWRKWPLMGPFTSAEYKMILLFFVFNKFKNLWSYICISKTKQPTPSIQTFLKKVYSHQWWKSTILFTYFVILHILICVCSCMQLSSMAPYIH